MKEQVGFEYVQTKDGQQRIVRSGLVPPGQGNYYQQPQPPRSNPHRAGHFAGLHGEDDPQLYDLLEEGEEYYVTRPHTSARRLQPGLYTQGNVKYHVQYTAPPARQRTHTDDEEDQPGKRGLRFHWLAYVGLVCFIGIIGWIGFTALGTWWRPIQRQKLYNNKHPREYRQSASNGAVPRH